MENKFEVGQQIGELTILGTGNSKKRGKYYFCKCICGNVGIIISESKFLTEKVENCGKCIGGGIDPSIYKHRLHGVWTEMKTRCYNKEREYYHLYGGRGIKVCPEWNDIPMGYPNFYKWALENGYKYEPFPNSKRNKWSLDRIDPNKDYSPDNCRWADTHTQTLNTRAETIVEHKGKSKKAREFLKEYNATVPFFYYLLKQGMFEKEAIEYIASLK